MKTEDFNFDLPEHLIAQYPLKNRTDSKLLHYNPASKTISHHQFRDLLSILEPHDLLILNNTKVIPARLFGQKQSGGQVELLVERILTNGQFKAHIRASKAPKPDSIIIIHGGAYQIKVLNKLDALYQCEVVNQEKMGDSALLHMLEEVGHMPLPLYIDRADDSSDTNRYQTVYNQHAGSVAAPTAGLHFDHLLLNQLQEHGIRIAYVTLHIGAGTFQPVRVDDIKAHQMHEEWYEISQSCCDAIAETRAAEGRVIAVGTTSMRTLESAAKHQGINLTPHAKETNIFIYPGFEFKICDGLITNFHLPKSSLIMLVAAFIGLDAVMTLYHTAIAHEYRFYSYGDATLLL